MSFRARAFYASAAVLMLSSCGAEGAAAAAVSTAATVTLPPASAAGAVSSLDDRETEEGSPAAGTKSEVKPAGVCPEYYNVVPEKLFYDTAPIVQAYKTGSRTGLDKMQNEILDKAAEILDWIITDDMTDYEKELAVHDYIVQNCTYDEGSRAVIPKPAENSDNPYGALVNGIAICTGYATSFRLLTEMLGIPCEYVYYFEPDKTDHAWNVVTIDGAKYYVDVTWDDPVPDKGRRLTHHEYFNVSRRDLARDHTLPTTAPDTPVLKDTYASHTLSAQPADEEALRALIAEAVADGNDGRNSICFIPADGSLWSMGFSQDGDSYKISDKTLKQSVARVLGRDGCYFTEAVYADTDKGIALFMMFKKEFSENKTEESSAEDYGYDNGYDYY